MNLDELQSQHAAWLAHNFANQPKHHGMLGLIEEVGELARAQLKTEQKIRGSAVEHRLAMIDAVGDIVIFLTSFCNSHNIVLSEAVRIAWDEVRGRDWIKFPENGRTK